MMKCTPVDAEHLSRIFLLLRPLLYKGEKYWGEYYNLIDLYKEIRRGKMQLWIGVEKGEIKLCAITCIIIYPKVKYVRIVYMGGEGLRGARDYIKEIEAWGARYGAVGTEFLGRAPWERRLKQLGVEGFEKKATLMTRKFQ